MPKKALVAVVPVPPKKCNHMETILAISNSIGSSSTNLTLEILRIVNETLTNELATVTKTISDAYSIDYEELNEMVSGFVSSEHLGPLNNSEKRAVQEEVEAPPVKKRVVKKVRRVVKGEEKPERLTKRVVKRIVKKKVVKEPEVEPEVETCAYMIRNSEGDQTLCLTEVEDGSEHCVKHAAIAAKMKKRVPKKVEVEPEPEVDEESEEEEDVSHVPETDGVVVLRKNKWGNMEHYQTHFVFDSDNRVVGKQANTNKVLPLTDADMRTCQERDWDYEEPGDSE
jgi:hypothetical protein